MSSAQRVAAVHHELRPRRYMAGFPKGHPGPDRETVARRREVPPKRCKMSAVSTLAMISEMCVIPNVRRASRECPTTMEAFVE